MKSEIVAEKAKKVDKAKEVENIAIDLVENDEDLDDVESSLVEEENINESVDETQEDIHEEMEDDIHEEVKDGNVSAEDGEY